MMEIKVKKDDVRKAYNEVTRHDVDLLKGGGIGQLIKMLFPEAFEEKRVGGSFLHGATTQKEWAEKWGEEKKECSHDWALKGGAGTPYGYNKQGYLLFASGLETVKFCRICGKNKVILEKKEPAVPEESELLSLIRVYHEVVSVCLCE